jgi:hypothetical protein
VKLELSHDRWFGAVVRKAFETEAIDARYANGPCQASCLDDPEPLPSLVDVYWHKLVCLAEEIAGWWTVLATDNKNDK